MRSVSTAIGGSIGVIMLGATLVSAAASSANTINACVNDVTGIVRVIDPAKGAQCIAAKGGLHETPMSWNQQGPAGAPGTPGPAGPPGAAGPAGGGTVETGGTTTVLVNVGVTTKFHTACSAGTPIGRNFFADGEVHIIQDRAGEEYGFPGWIMEIVNLSGRQLNMQVSAICLR